MAASPQPSQSPQTQVQKTFQLGQRAVESGQYRQAIVLLCQALAMAGDSTPQGGDIQLWLVTAYDAAGQRDQALTLCRTLTTHSCWTTRKQSKRILYILEAPKLTLHREWLTEIPDLTAVQGESQRGGITRDRPRAAPKPQGYKILPDLNEGEDDGQVGSSENGFIVFSMVASAFILLALFLLA